MVRRRFRATAEEAIREPQTPAAYFAAVLEAQMTERAERREKRRPIDARLAQIKRLRECHFQAPEAPGSPQIAALGEGSRIDALDSFINLGGMRARKSAPGR
ncbi:hypothetical protein AYO39_02425 [Actinobacteria bacterium SCGC AG-212-D09]|nr:hypothetical protein AYO39_02425 [Actinobacteria bacterium SCGC AG-212-D09]